MAIDKNNEQVSLDFGFQAEYTEFEGYTTISGKEQTNVTNMTGYGIADIDIGNYVTGRPELAIFRNEEKDEEGNYVRNYMSVRARLIDFDEYVDLYANIPRMDENGFIHNINKFQNFYRTGFDLCFSFMRFMDETNIINSEGEEINKIKSINIENVCKAIDQMEYCKIKIIKGADEQYNSWIILDMKNKV